MTALGRLSFSRAGMRCALALLALGTLVIAPAPASAQQPAPAPSPFRTPAPPAPTTGTPAPATPPATPPAAPATGTKPATPAPAPTTTPPAPATGTKPATPTTGAPATPAPATPPTATPPTTTPPTATPPTPAPAPTPPAPGPVADAGDGGKPIPPPPPPTPAQLEAAKAAFLAGKKAFDEKQLDVAVEKFKESYRLSRNPLLLYNVGFTFDQMGQKDKALFYYNKFLSDAPADAAQRAEVTARAKVLDAELAAAAAAETGTDTTPTPGGKKPPKPARTFDISEFDHQVIEEAPPGRPLDLTAYVPEDSGWVVTMFYRAGGDAKFTSVAMRPRYNEQVGRIPADKMQGTSIQYYLEVRTPDGKVLTRVGKPGSPNIVYLETKARPRYYPDLEDASGAFVEVGPTTTVRPSGNKRDDGLPDGGYFEVGTKQFRRGKWISTGVSVVALGTSLTFYLMAAGNASTLEGEAAAANDDSECGAAQQPCKTFGSFGRSLQQVGQRNELVSRITFGVGVAAVGVAAYYWYKDVKAARQRERAAATATTAPPPATGLESLITVPVASDGYIGGAAAIRF